MAHVQDRGPPSAAAIAIGTAIVAGLTGYFLGQASSIGLFGNRSANAPGPRLARSEGQAKPDDAETQSDDGEDDDDDSDVQDLGELQTFPGNSEECKLVLVVRSDLGMTKGTFSCSYLSFLSACKGISAHYVSAMHATVESGLLIWTIRLCRGGFLRGSDDLLLVNMHADTHMHR